MHNTPTPDYREYHLTIGNTDFSFISDSKFIAERQMTGISMHSHNFYEMFYVIYGTITLVTEYGNLQLSEGDCAVIAPGVTHTSILHSHTKRLTINFSFEKNKSKFDNKYYHIFKTIFKKDTIHLPDFSGIHAFKRIIKYVNSNHPDQTELITACLHEIMILIKTSQFSEKATEEPVNIPDSNNYRKYLIDEYFVDKFQNASLTKLAALLHLSPQQTQRIVKEMYHQTFTERVTQMRMEHAKKLLTTTNLSVANIAAECGYTGSNGFFVAFKKHFGTTPKELKKDLDFPMENPE